MWIIHLRLHALKQSQRSRSAGGLRPQVNLPGRPISNPGTAVVREIGERLQAYLKAEPDLPERLSKQVGQLRVKASRRQSFPTRSTVFGSIRVARHGAKL